MKDPESVRFGQVAQVSDQLVCGYVSGRNGFGGMTEMKAFMHGSKMGGLMMGEQGGRTFFRIWNAQCVKQPAARPVKHSDCPGLSCARGRGMKISAVQNTWKRAR